MKSRWAIFLALFGFFAPEVNARTVEALVTCQQDEGDQWLEVAIVLNDGPGLNALLIRHNTDHQSARLVRSFDVLIERNQDNTVYRNIRDNVRLTVDGNNKGKFSVIADGPGSTNLESLKCYENTKVTFGRSQ